MYDAMNEFEEHLSTRGRFASDKGVQARFFNKPILDEEASAKKGRRIYKEVVFIQIMVPGMTNNTVERKATDEDKQRFRTLYVRFMETGESTDDGTPLDQVTWLDRAQVEELALFRIRTVEALAHVSDDACGRMAGLYDLKRRAQAFLEKAEKEAPFTQMAARNEELESQVKALQTQMQELIKASKAAPKAE